MSEEQLEALLAYIDARIEERLTRNSCGPHVSDNREIRREAKERLMAVFLGGAHR